MVVIYKMLPVDSPTLRTLLHAAEDTGQSGLDLSILLRDNTPGGQPVSSVPAGVRYEAAPLNPGLADAYNRALEVASAEGHEWLLTLDQDTVLPEDFLRELAKVIRDVQLSASIAAVVPQVASDGRNISPFRFILGTVPQTFPLGYFGAPSGATYAINSAATLRVSAVLAIGGYDPAFPLDISDLNLFHRLARAGKSVFVAGNIVIGHDFSLLKKHSRMSVQRYRSLLHDECAFWDMNMGAAARFERMFRLCGRVCKDLIATENSAFQGLTLAEIRRRLLTRRSKRVSEWKQWAEARSLSARTEKVRSEILG